MNSWTQEKAAALEASRRASEVLRRYFGELKEIKTKPDTSLVSEADKESERVIKATFAEFGLEYGFLGEETGSTAQKEKSKLSRGRWIVDPLDGTTNYIHGFPYFCVSIALEVEGDLKVAVVNAPMLNQVYWAVRGQGAFLDDRRLRVREISDLSECLLSTGFYYLKEKDLAAQVETFHQLIPLTHGVRRAGAAALDLSFVASGVFDGFWERGLKAWDTAAGVLLIEEAGGIVTDYFGKPFQLDSETVVGCSRAIQSQLIGVLSDQEGRL